jgi:hypothetical protein
MLYLCFGALPSTYLLSGSGAFPIFGSWFHHSWREYSFLAYAVEGCAVIGTIALWCATIASIPINTRWISRCIIASLILGMFVMAPYATALIYGTFADVIQHRAATLNTLGGALDCARSAVFVCWSFIGPLVVAIHYIWRASTSGSSDRGVVTSVSQGGSR